MGPPVRSPFSFRVRYFTESTASAYFVPMPTSPDTQSQNTAPGPPIVTAPATPAMFPMPIVAASAVASDWNGVTSPFPALRGPRIWPSVFFMMRPKCLNCTNPILRPMMRPTRIIPGARASRAAWFSVSRNPVIFKCLPPIPCLSITMTGSPCYITPV